MDIEALKESIESFTEDQVRKFNQSSVCKIYDKSEATVSPSELEQVLYAVDAVESLDSVELDYLNNQLVASKELSKRPC